MLQTNPDWLTFDPEGVPPSQDEIDEYIETLRPQSAAAKRRTLISLGISFGSVICFIYAFVAWMTFDPAPFSEVKSLIGPALLFGVLISVVCGFGFTVFFHLKHAVIQQRIESSRTAYIDQLEDLLDMVNHTGIRPVYLDQVSAQKRELMAYEALGLKDYLADEKWNREQAENQRAIQAGLGVPIGKIGSS